MQSLIDYAPFWLAYFGFAVLGLWSWQRIFFLLFKHKDIRSLITVLGAALLFTPAPASVDSQHFSPAIFVLLMDVLSGVSPLQSPALIWLLAAACIGVFAVAIIALSLRAKKNN